MKTNEQKERIISILNKIQSHGISGIENENFVQNETIAEYLLENGVIAPKMQIGQVCYLARQHSGEVEECVVTTIIQKPDGSFAMKIKHCEQNFIQHITMDEIGKSIFFTELDAKKSFEKIKKITNKDRFVSIIKSQKLTDHELAKLISDIVKETIGVNVDSNKDADIIAKWLDKEIKE